MQPNLCSSLTLHLFERKALCIEKMVQQIQKQWLGMSIKVHFKLLSVPLNNILWVFAMQACPHGLR